MLQPTEREVEQALANVDTYVAGIGELFAKYKIAGADEALKAMSTQLKDYASWTHSTVLPKARKDTRLPEPLYAYQLKQVGIDIAPQQLIQRAQLEFMETRSAMRQLAPLVAKAKGVQGEDYVQVIRALKRNTIADDQLETHYRGVIDQIDPIIRQQRIVDVPKRPMQMRLGSAAESAAQPAPHFLPAPLIGNTGQQGQFVLPLGNPGAEVARKSSTTTSTSARPPGRSAPTKAARGTNCSSPRWWSAACRWRAACSPSTRSTSKAGRCTPKPRWCRTNRSTGS